MFSRVLSRGFFRQGFPGWYRGRFSEVIPSHPGTFSLALQTPSCALISATAGLGLDLETAGFTLERQY